MDSETQLFYRKNFPKNALPQSLEQAENGQGSVERRIVPAIHALLRQSLYTQ